MLEGRWTYRSYRNTPALVRGDAQAALGLIFGEGVFSFEAAESGRFGGRFDMGPGYALTLEGEVLGDDGSGFSIVGVGVEGTQTEGWRYDYRGQAAYEWPNAANQVPSLVGTVIRVNPHGGAAAGFTASFVAVRNADAAEPA